MLRRCTGCWSTASNGFCLLRPHLWLRKWHWPLNHTKLKLLTWGSKLSNIYPPKSQQGQTATQQTNLSTNPLCAFHATLPDFPARRTTDGDERSTVRPPAGRFCRKETPQSQPSLKVMPFHLVLRQAWAVCHIFLIFLQQSVPHFCKRDPKAKLPVWSLMVCTLWSKMPPGCTVHVRITKWELWEGSRKIGIHLNTFPMEKHKAKL